MSSSLFQRVIIPATCLSLLPACHNFTPALRENYGFSGKVKTSSPTATKLSSYLGEAAEVSRSDLNRLKNLTQGRELCHAYLEALSLDPNPTTALALNTILKSKTFTQSSSSDQIALLEILSPALTADRAERFKKCFLSAACFSALNSKDLMGQRLLVNLHALAKSPFSDQLESQRGAMVAALLEHACGLRPLDQGDTNGCGPVSCLLALDNKAEIIRIIQGLSSPEGKVRLASGAILARSNSSIRNNGDTEQGSALRILSASVLDHANGNLLSYSSRLDINNIGPLGFPGMLPAWGLQAISDLTGKHHTLLKGQEASISNLENALKNSNYAIMLIMASPIDWHWIVVRKIDGDKAYFQDPNGCPFALASSEKSKNETNKKLEFPIKLPRLFEDKSEINFPAKPDGNPLLGTYKVDLDSLQRCTKAIIIPSYAHR